MARSKTFWLPAKKDPTNIAAATIAIDNISVNAGAITGRDSGQHTVRRIVGTIIVRHQTPGNGLKHFYVGIKAALDTVDVADFSSADFETNDDGWLHTIYDAIAGIAGDSTAVANLIPSYRYNIDTRVMRRIGRGNALFLVFDNDSDTGLEYAFYTRTLVSESL